MTQHQLHFRGNVLRPNGDQSSVVHVESVEDVPQPGSLNPDGDSTGSDADTGSDQNGSGDGSEGDGTQGSNDTSDEGSGDGSEGDTQDQ